MIYSRCLYYVMLLGDNDMRIKFPLGRTTVYNYIHHACQLLKCDPVQLWVGNGAFLLLVDLNTSISLDDFISRLKSMTSSWIMGETPFDPLASYWMPANYIRVVSPEDKSAAAAFVADLSPERDIERLIKKCRMTRHDSDSHPKESQPIVGFRHQIILITSRARLLLNLRFSALLADMVADVAASLGLGVIKTAARRNHIHLYCFVPSNMYVADVIEKLQAQLLALMQANIHFHKIDEWYKDTIAYTVSDRNAAEEGRVVATQNYIHGVGETINEMSELYRCLDIRWVASLH